MVSNKSYKNENELFQILFNHTFLFIVILKLSSNLISLNDLKSGLIRKEQAILEREIHIKRTIKSVF